MTPAMAEKLAGIVDAHREGEHPLDRAPMMRRAHEETREALQEGDSYGVTFGAAYSGVRARRAEVAYQRRVRAMWRQGR